MPAASRVVYGDTDILYEGYLSHSHNDGQTWQRAYYVLSEQGVFFWDSEEQRAKQNQKATWIRKQRINHLTLHPADLEHFSLFIGNKHGRHRTLTLKAAQDVDDWVSIYTKQGEAHDRSLLYPLSLIMLRVFFFLYVCFCIFFCREKSGRLPLLSIY